MLLLTAAGLDGAFRGARCASDACAVSSPRHSARRTHRPRTITRTSMPHAGMPSARLRPVFGGHQMGGNTRTRTCTRTCIRTRTRTRRAESVRSRLKTALPSVSSAGGGVLRTHGRRGGLRRAVRARLHTAAEPAARAPRLQGAAAAALHRPSPRRGTPFPGRSCPSVPSDTRNGIFRPRAPTRGAPKAITVLAFLCWLLWPCPQS